MMYSARLNFKTNLKESFRIEIYKLHSFHRYNFKIKSIIRDTLNRKTMSTSELQQQLIEYESQLADIEEMIALDPSDKSIQKLKSDLEELISLTKSGVTAADVGDTTDVSEEQEQGVNENVLSNTTSQISHTSSSSALESSGGIALSKNSSASHLDSSEGLTNDEDSNIQKGTDNNSKEKTKKMKVPSEFAAPSHLTPLASDTDAEKNKKRRTLKALKSKWRERVKEISSEKKQKSWKDFNNKKRKKSSKKDDSIFRTTDGVSAKVGVIGSGKSMTGYGERKRFKL